MFGGISLKIFGDVSGRRKFESYLVWEEVSEELGFILTFLPVCASKPQTQYLITDNHEIAAKSANKRDC